MYADTQAPCILGSELHFILETDETDGQINLLIEALLMELKNQKGNYKKIE